METNTPNTLGIKNGKPIQPGPKIPESKKKGPKALLHFLKNIVDKKSSIKIKKFYLALLQKTNFLN
ncbi:MULTISPECIES: hypothetical protein [Leptospira]|uniref:Uncharacterized protein n=6 Tax=Leptospira borgpetersenii TaxID=174 RepID=M3FGQ4_LEPBO|nr:hypothetical protein [Leptospira borgpetersenii]AXX15592.1 hypothetical protein C4Q31_08615 [Leptospira borgpetersenii serovar Ceylonica]EMG01013.1 hypothetical protein LEP1GSC123_3651 [Leptospira borgpetersenii str. 200701203]EMK09403.1 hypothetical protein LEP1GSC066_1416 [Leptospira sp. serovar Kenya str. Sh9]EMO09900.1 hypothetical protein LEP1GSC137_1823 [Leptospira borgpetersenii str. Noumea 25]EMO61859.1 hypothetical protein LEP1GSC133_2071 [Leptospira borgpetersenii serovar Pomona s